MCRAAGREARDGHSDATEQVTALPGWGGESSSLESSAAAPLALLEEEIHNARLPASRSDRLVPTGAQEKALGSQLL